MLFSVITSGHTVTIQFRYCNKDQKAFVFSIRSLSFSKSLVILKFPSKRKKALYIIRPMT